MTERLLIDAGLRSGMRVLDVGCGRGDVTLLAAKLVGALKLPVPVPNKIETLLSFATARSSLRSPLKSPTATERGSGPTAKLVGALKLPVPVPSKIETL